jgi:CHAT domain-containing protein
VLSELERHAIAHFACHGAHDSLNPAHSKLYLHDHAANPFTVADLAAIDLGHASLAYLSACETALASNSDLLEETITLSSAFQLAGFRNVIGALWRLRDSAAVAVAESFYTTLIDPQTGYPDTSRSALALHDATRAQRDRLPTRPEYWAALVHVGP